MGMAQLKLVREIEWWWWSYGGLSRCQPKDVGRKDFFDQSQGQDLRRNKSKATGPESAHSAPVLCQRYATLLLGAWQRANHDDSAMVRAMSMGVAIGSP